MAPSRIDAGIAGRIVALGAASLLTLVACGNAGTSTDYAPEDRPEILVSQDTAPEGTTVEPGDVGRAALILPLPPGAPAFDESAFVDALTTRIGHTMTGGYTSWAALFETPTDAEQAFEFFARQHEADEGWGLEPLQPNLELADDAVMYTGPYGPWETASIYFWRESNLLLAAIGSQDYEPEILEAIAEGMDSRAD
jgi:hypothetical protein